MNTRRPPSKRPPGHVPLDRALSKRGLASRTEAVLLILAGRIRVNGITMRSPQALVVPERVTITIDGQHEPPRMARLLMLHKPRGVVTTRRDPEGRRTVFDVLGETGTGLQAVGRLDLASTGLLLFTNDTRLAHDLTDPARAILRRYIVTVRGRVDPRATRQLELGLDTTGRTGTERLSASKVSIHKASSRETHLLVELTEGRNREIRRLFDAIGHEATRVHRIQFGEYALGALQPGEWRELPLEQFAAVRAQPALRLAPRRTE